jgi:hypothetical protein
MVGTSRKSLNSSRSAICIMKAESNSPLTLVARALERWENEGGRVTQVNPQPPPTLLPFVGSPGARKNLETVKKDSRRHAVQWLSPDITPRESC